MLAINVVMRIDEEELSRAVAFHGHLCFGLCVGLAAARHAMEILSMSKAKDEELVVIAENSSCAVDAIQCLAGATLGRGNLIMRDWGKHVYTFGRRSDSKAVRLALRYDAFKGLRDMRRRIEKVLDARAEEIFDVRELTMELPPRAEVERSVQCSFCREPVMRTRTKSRDGKLYCIPCYEKVYIQQP